MAENQCSLPLQRATRLGTRQASSEKQGRAPSSSDGRADGYSQSRRQFFREQWSPGAGRGGDARGSGAEPQLPGAARPPALSPGSINAPPPAARSERRPQRGRRGRPSGTGVSFSARVFIIPALWCFSFICVEIELHRVPNVPAARAAEVGDLRAHEIIDTSSAALATAVPAQLTTSPLL